jgi:hypothetical protein
MKKSVMAKSWNWPAQEEASRGWIDAWQVADELVFELILW